jgi:slime mold repeat-containing protein
LRIHKAVLVAVLALLISSASGISATEAGHLFLVDSPFSPLVTRIYEVDPASAALTLKGDLGLSYTPVLGMAAADALTFYIAGTDTTPSNACEGLRSCLLLKVVLDPGSPTPASVQLIGVIQQGGNVVTEITGLTFRQDGQLYGISQVTFSLYRIDIATAAATLVGAAGPELHGGDITFDDQDRLFAWTNIGAASGIYLMDPDTGLASAYELHPNVEMAGMATLKHGPIGYGASAVTNRLHTMDFMGGFNSGVVMTLGGSQFDHSRGDLDSPYCDDDAACDDEVVCTADSCSPGGCLHSAIAGCCVVDSECNDGNPCTQDRCQANQCANPPAIDDFNVCTQDLCDPESGPVHLPIENCCLSDTVCNDFNDCTRDSCEANRCIHRSLISCGPGQEGTVKKQDRGGGP